MDNKYTPKSLILLKNPAISVPLLLAALLIGVYLYKQRPVKDLQSTPSSQASQTTPSPSTSATDSVNWATIRTKPSSWTRFSVAQLGISFEYPTSWGAPIIEERTYQPNNPEDGGISGRKINISFENLPVGLVAEATDFDLSHAVGMDGDEYKSISDARTACSTADKAQAQFTDCHESLNKAGIATLSASSWLWDEYHVNGYFPLSQPNFKDAWFYVDTGIAYGDPTPQASYDLVAHILDSVQPIK